MATTDAAMDVDKTTQAAQPTPKPANFYVPAPSDPDDLHSNWTSKNSSDQKLLEFLTRWPPSRTPHTYGPWISANRGGSVATPTLNIEGLQKSFESLAEAGKVTETTIDKISKQHGVVVGKWMVFEEASKVDILWGKIVYQVVQKGKGYAKVSTQKDGEKHVICVYAQDYTNKEEVKALRKMLRSVGVKWKIGFKTDAYTHLNIYKNNTWNIRPSRFHE